MFFCRCDGSSLEPSGKLSTRIYLDSVPVKEYAWQLQLEAMVLRMEDAKRHDRPSPDPNAAHLYGMHPDHALL